MERRENKYQWTWTTGLRKSKEYSKTHLDHLTLRKVNSRHEHSNEFSYQHDKGTFPDQRITSKDASEMLKNQLI